MEKKRHILSCPGRQVGKRGREGDKEREGKAKGRKIKKEGKIAFILVKFWCSKQGLLVEARKASTKMKKASRKIL